MRSFVRFLAVFAVFSFSFLTWAGSWLIIDPDNVMHAVEWADPSGTFTTQICGPVPGYATITWPGAQGVTTN